MPSQTERKAQLVEFIHNNNLASLWVDAFRVGIREDQIVSINFYAAQPEGQIEQARIVSAEEPLKNLINTLCKSIDYYPNKDSSKKS